MATYTLHFCGTDCWPSEGEIEEPGIHPGFFCEESGYIPVRLYNLAKKDNTSFVIPGPGAPWAAMWNQLWIPSSIKTLGGGGRDTATGESMWDLAGHALACCVGTPTLGRGTHDKKHLPSSQLCEKLNEILGSNFQANGQGKGQCWWSAYSLEHLYQRLIRDKIDRRVDIVNMIGHSRGGVAAIMASHDIHALFPNAGINIFAIDPVPGSGTLTIEMMSLSKGVKNYVGVYAIDERSSGFNGVVPKYYNEARNLIDPLKNSPTQQNGKTENNGLYRLIYAPGRHGTVAGLKTVDGQSNLASKKYIYDTSESKINDVVGHVPRLVYRLAESCFTKWSSKSEKNILKAYTINEMQSALKEPDNVKLFRAMREFGYVPKSPSHHNERGVTSSNSSNPSDWYYLEDVIGIEPLVKRKTLLYKGSRSQKGQVNWKAIEDLEPIEFGEKVTF